MKKKVQNKTDVGRSKRRGPNRNRSRVRSTLHRIKERPFSKLPTLKQAAPNAVNGTEEAKWKEQDHNCFRKFQCGECCNIQFVSFDTLNSLEVVLYNLVNLDKVVTMGDVLKRARNDFNEYEEDAMAEILARLPVKDLIRFRCVCKSWRALISSSYFVKKHLSYSQSYKLNFMLNPPLFLDLDSMKNIEVGEGARAQSAVTQMELPATETFSFYRAVVGSCNGLMCVQVENFEAVMIWNPCTREFKVLPNPPPVIKSKDRHCFYGFGYDSASDDYKVIRGFTSYRNPAEAITIAIFALKTGSWMTVKCHNYVRIGMWQGLFLNGALHWLCDLSEVGNLILAFDLGSEKFHEIPLPFDSLFCDPLIHKNCLCVVACPTGTDTFDVWIMKEYGVKESWTEDLQVSMESYYQNDDGDDRGFFKPVCILENGVIMIDWMGLCDHLSVYSIPKDRTMKRVVELMADLEFRTVVYQETLVSPNVHTCKTQSAS